MRLCALANCVRVRVLLLLLLLLLCAPALLREAPAEAGREDGGHLLRGRRRLSERMTALQALWFCLLHMPTATAKCIYHQPLQQPATCCCPLQAQLRPV